MFLLVEQSSAVGNTFEKKPICGQPGDGCGRNRPCCYPGRCKPTFVEGSQGFYIETCTYGPG
ncbi:hypothetical protein Vi05172_g5001 [Venturia inaequalis]|nr:hypothetical protein Vi05172_g5001 [Venturia inaequalis]